MANKRLLDKLIDPDPFEWYPSWLCVWLGAAFLVSAILVFWDKSVSFAEALVNAILCLLLGVCMIVVGLIKGFSRKPLSQLTRTKGWAGLLVGLTLFVAGVDVSWKDAAALWSELSQLRTPERNKIIHVVIGIFVVFLGGQMMAAGFRNFSSGKFISSGSPNNNPAEQSAAADRPREDSFC